MKEWCDVPWDAEQKKFAWVVALADSNKSIGIFLVELENDYSVQIHYGISHNFTRQGFVTEAGCAVLAWLSAQKGIKKIWAPCDLYNYGSKRVLEKLGFQNQKILKDHLVLPAFGNSPRDCYHYTYNVYKKS